MNVTVRGFYYPKTKFETRMLRKAERAGERMVAVYERHANLSCDVLARIYRYVGGEWVS